MRRDPWDFVGIPAYLATLGLVRLTERFRMRKRFDHPFRITEEPEAISAWCGLCGETTVWEALNWVVEQAVDWECTLCGDVLYGE